MDAHSEPNAANRILICLFQNQKANVRSFFFRLIYKQHKNDGTYRDGKYKGDKKQRPIKIALSFQNIETVNEGAEDRKHNLELFASGRDTEWRSRLIWDEKKYVLPSLLPEFAGKVSLIYINPPFDMGADFSFTASIPDDSSDSEKALASLADVAAMRWCENASNLAKVTWRYVKVPEKGFEVLKPSCLSDLIALQPSSLF